MLVFVGVGECFVGVKVGEVCYLLQFAIEGFVFCRRRQSFG